MGTTTKTREQWLEQAVRVMRPAVKKATGLDMPEVRVSVGFGLGGTRGASLNIAGQCHYLTEDGRPALFVSPVINDGARVLDIVLHEMLHATLGAKAGHGPVFKKAATAAGLAGPATATKVEAGSPLADTIEKWLGRLGDYPHARVYTDAGQVPGPEGGEPGEGGEGEGGPVTSHPKQTTRMLKVACEGCDYTVRTTLKWLTVAIPCCPNPECPQAGEQMTPDEKAQQALAGKEG